MSVRVRVGSLFLHDWKPLEVSPGRWADVFVFDMPPELYVFPPAEVGLAIRRACAPLPKLWKGAALWVRYNVPGRWYAAEIRKALVGVRNLPVAVSRKDSPPSLTDFSLHPQTSPFPGSPPLFVDVPDDGFPARERRCLAVLARVRAVSAAEIASLSGVSIPTCKAALRALSGRGLVIQKEGEWHIRPRKGLSKALRSLGFPPGVTLRREKLYGQSERHRRQGRLWPQRLRGLPSVSVWGGWSEPGLAGGRRHPDALCWGSLDRRETLFWLEVESGHKKTETLIRQMFRRMNSAVVYARSYGLPMVFAVAGPPRIAKAMRSRLRSVPSDAAVLLLPWAGRANTIPTPLFGQVQPGATQDAFSLQI